MRPSYSIVTCPVAEPITYDEAAAHLRVDSTDDIDYVNGLVSVAREYVDSVTHRSSSTTSWKVTAPSWDSLFDDQGELPVDYYEPLKGILGPVGSLYVMRMRRTPLQSVTSIKYYAPDASSQTTLASSAYRVVTAAEPGIVQLVDSPPSVDDRADAIEIVFTAGDEDADAMHKHAIKMMVAQLYENRMPVAFASCSKIPFTLEDLLTAQRVGGWF